MEDSSFQQRSILQDRYAEDEDNNDHQQQISNVRQQTASAIVQKIIRPSKAMDFSLSRETPLDAMLPRAHQQHVRFKGSFAPMEAAQRFPTLQGRETFRPTNCNNKQGKHIDEWFDQRCREKNPQSDSQTASKKTTNDGKWSLNLFPSQ
jgi:hypothetical protein